jgi:hypothetical protein
MKSIRFTLLTTLMTVAAVVTTMAQTPADNKRIIKAGFDRWAQGTGSFFDLLTDDMRR